VPTHSKVVYPVAAGDALSRPDSSATACSTTVPLKKPGLLRVCSMATLLNVNSRKSCSVMKPSLGYSTVGSAEIGLWMSKEIGAFDQPCAAEDLIDLGKSDTVL
jgi:hypothetical protein